MRLRRLRPATPADDDPRLDPTRFRRSLFEAQSLAERAAEAAQDGQLDAFVQHRQAMEARRDAALAEVVARGRGLG